MTNRSIGLSSVLTQINQVENMNCIDDIPPLSTQKSSLEIWKSLLEYNSKYLIDRVACQKNLLNNELKLWLCSLDYTRGTSALLHVTGDKNFIENHINLFLINLNYGIVKSYIEHRLGNKLIHILDYTLDLRMRYTVHRRFRSLVTQEAEVKKWIDNYDGIQDSLCYMVYYLNKLQVKFEYPFERWSSYVQYIGYVERKKFLGGLMNSPKWNQILEYLCDRYTVDEMIQMNLLKTRFYNIECYDMVVELIRRGTLDKPQYSSLLITLTPTRPPATPNPDINIPDILNNNTHVGVIRRTHDLATILTPEDTDTIQELMVVHNWTLRDTNRYYLCWPLLYVDVLYLKATMLFIKRNKLDPSLIIFRVSTDHMMEPCGQLLIQLKNLGVDVKIDMDYSNSSIDVLQDLLAHPELDNSIRIIGTSNNVSLREFILYHKHPILVNIMTSPSRMNKSRTLGISSAGQRRLPSKSRGS